MRVNDSKLRLNHVFKEDLSSKMYGGICFYNGSSTIEKLTTVVQYTAIEEYMYMLENIIRTRMTPSSYQELETAFLKRGPFISNKL